MLTKITHITLFVHDQEAALNFYTNLGFVVHTDALFGTMRWLTLNLPDSKSLELVLMKAESEQEKALVGKQAGDKPLVSLESNDAHKDHERLKGLGIAELQDPETQPWGISFGFKDLYGNVLYVCQPSQI